MRSNKFNFWINCLIIANIFTCLVGVFSAYFGSSIIFFFWNEGVKTVFFEGNELPYNVSLFYKFILGPLGGTILGFHLLMLFIIHYALRKKEKWSFNALSIGLCAWFIVDSSITLYYGAYFNFFYINIFALSIIGFPLLCIKKEIYKN